MLCTTFGWGFESMGKSMDQMPVLWILEGLFLFFLSVFLGRPWGDMFGQAPMWWGRGRISSMDFHNNAHMGKQNIWYTCSKRGFIDRPARPICLDHPSSISRLADLLGNQNGSPYSSLDGWLAMCDIFPYMSRRRPCLAIALCSLRRHRQRYKAS